MKLDLPFFFFPVRMQNLTEKKDPHLRSQILDYMTGLQLVNFPLITDETYETGILRI